MFDLTLDPSVLERLASHLELWSTGLTGVERSHLLALVGLGSAAISAADAVASLARPLPPVIEVDALAMLSPGFGDALSPAGDAAHRCATAGHSVAIIYGPETDRWTVASRPVCLPSDNRRFPDLRSDNQGFP
jgi:hypothetical protein